MKHLAPGDCYRSGPALYGRNALEQTKRSTNRGRCEHDAYPVEVLAVADGKKIALCLGCGRSGPVRGSSTEALMALRESPRLATQASRPGKRKRFTLMPPIA